MDGRESPATGTTPRLSRLFETPETGELRHFLLTRDPGEIDSLYAFADSVRRKYVGEEIHLRAIIEFSNHCRRSCQYCGIRTGFPGVTRYRMTHEEVVATARTAVDLGYRTMVLQSGEDPYFTADSLCRMVEEIRNLGDVAITLALGERPASQYRAFFAAGAERYLLKHETSDPELYARLNPGMSLERRLECLRELKEIGFQTGSGIMIGLPGQTIESIADDIMLFYRMDIDMIGCGPYIPISGCPAGMGDALREELSYRVLALNRIVTRDSHLPSTTALSTLNEEDARIKALSRGANVIMPNLTPARYRHLYEIYPNKRRTEVDHVGFRAEIERFSRRLGRPISRGRGDHPGWKSRDQVGS